MLVKSNLGRNDWLIRMNKVYIITRHAITNYGSLLQSIATQEVVNSIGYQSQIIDYIRTDEEYKKIAITNLSRNQKWNSNAIKKMVYLCIQNPEYILMGKRFEQFRKKYLNLTHQISSREELNALGNEDAIFLTGSDQVWGPIGTDNFDSAYFLEFVSTDNKKFAYAASFGRTKFTEEVMEIYKSLLEKYDSIAVRENSAAKILVEMGLNDVKQVLDPTLLLDSVQWEKLIEPAKIEGKYILIYQLHSNPEMDRYADSLAKKLNLPLFRVTPSLHQVMRTGKTIYLPNLSRFLGLIKYATFMVTDSFHGTAFAINFGTQFVNVLSSNRGNSNIDATKTRNLSILELLHLQDRVLRRYDDFDCFNSKIDYLLVNNILKRERERSISVLKEMLRS